MSWALIITTLLIGLLLVVLEIVALPGGIAGVCGAILSAIAVWQTYMTHGTTAGNIVLLSAITVGIALLVFFMKTRTWRHFQLNEEMTSKTNTIDTSAIQIGSTGTTLTRVAPSGNAQFGDQVVEVHTVSEFLDPNVAVQVTEIDGYKITVKAIDE